MDAKELGEVVGRAINNYSFSNKDFCKVMAREHRTIQQSFTRLCFEWIKTCADMEHFDGRNEDSVMACRKLQKVIEEEDIGLPFV